MAVLKIVAVCVWLYLSVCCQAKKYPQVTFMENDLANHSYLDLSLVGTNDSDSVKCHTDVKTCCSAGQGLHIGDWIFPNGARIEYYQEGDIYQRRNNRTVGLYSNSGSESGIYYCKIALKNGFDSKRIGFFYIGLYQYGGEYFIVIII